MAWGAGGGSARPTGFGCRRNFSGRVGGGQHVPPTMGLEQDRAPHIRLTNFHIYLRARGTCRGWQGAGETHGSTSCNLAGGERLRERGVREQLCEDKRKHG